MYNLTTLRIFLTQLVHLVVGEGEGVDAPGQILAAPAKKNNNNHDIKKVIGVQGVFLKCKK